MSRRTRSPAARIRRLPMMGMVVAALFPSWALRAAEPGARKPNILFAIADDWSFGHAGAYGCTWVKTPAMDRVARDGILFTHAYTPCGKCAPSRACITTGRNPWQLKAAANHWCYFPPEFKTWPEAIGEHGYFTGMTGKGWGPGVATNVAGEPREMVGKPFARRSLTPPASGIAPNDYAANFADFLDAAPKGSPWCFWYGGYEPHRAYEFGSGVAKGGKALSAIDRVPACWPDNETVRNDMLDYAFEVEWFDAHLARMLADLEKRGLLDNTLVIVTSDNGMPFPHDKGYAYNDSVHLPLAVMWKNGIRKPGRVVDDYVSFIDFAPTLIETAGLKWGQIGMAGAAGRSLVDIFSSEASGRVVAARDHVLIGKERTDVGRPHDEGYPIRGIVKDDAIYLHNYEPSRWPGGNPETGYLDTDGSPTKTEVLKSRLVPAQKQFWDLSFGKRPEFELYDLRADTDCVKNLAGDPVYATRRDELAAQMDEELKRQADPRVSGQGHVFDEYPTANARLRDFYGKYMRVKIKAGWVNESDYEKAPLE